MSLSQQKKNKQKSKNKTFVDNNVPNFEALLRNNSFYSIRDVVVQQMLSSKQ